MKESNPRKRNDSSSSLPYSTMSENNSSSFISLINVGSQSGSHSRPRTFSTPHSAHIHIPHKQMSVNSDFSQHSQPNSPYLSSLQLKQNGLSNSMSQSHTLHIPLSETQMTPEPFPQHLILNSFTLQSLTTTFSKQSNANDYSPLPHYPLARKSITMTEREHMDYDYKTEMEMATQDNPNDIEQKQSSSADEDYNTNDENVLSQILTNDPPPPSHPHISNNNTADLIYELDESKMFELRGYKITKEIAATLQGFVYELQSLKDKNVKYVVKKTDKDLHRQGITVQNGKTYVVKEDILKEKRILEFITKNDPPSFLVEFVEFFESKDYYYLVMEHGGQDFFKFVIRAHEHIASGKLSIKVWRKFVKYVVWQLAVMVLWLHNTMKACHLDISLENLLVQNGNFVQQPDGKYTIDTNIQIKMCDFGLAEFFDSKAHNPYLCTKYCGKTTYKSPQVFSKNGPFDARKADIWSMGVVVFCMFVGAPPYKKPHCSDKGFGYLKRGQIINLLYQWGREKYLTERMLSIVGGLLNTDERKRMSADEIVQHPWLRSYYNKYYDFIKQDLASNINMNHY